MPLMTVEDLKQHIQGPNIPNEVLERLMENAEESIIQTCGPHADEADPIQVRRDGGGAWLFMSRPIDTTKPITVTEGGVEVPSSVYTVHHNGKAVERNSGTWVGTVIIDYVPVSDNGRRRMALVDLVKLGLTFSGYEFERIGDVQLEAKEYGKERGRILQSLLPGGGVRVL